MTTRFGESSSIITSTPQAMSTVQRALQRQKRRQRPLMGIPRYAVLLLGLLGLTSLCASCNSHTPKYQVEIDEDIVSIKSTDLGVPKEAMPKTGTLQLGNEPSRGRFPTGVGVIRVYAAMDETRGRRYLRVAKMEPAQGVYWNQLLVDLPPVREVKILRSWSFDPRGAQWENVLSQSAGVNCDLCVMYASVDDTEADAELIGVLWEVPTQKVLATYRVTVIMPRDDDDEEEEEASRKYKHGGKWKCEADFRADSEFRTLVRNTLWDLTQQDQKAPTTQPNPWHTDLPLYPRDYDHYRNRQRRDKRTP